MGKRVPATLLRCIELLDRNEFQADGGENGNVVAGGSESACVGVDVEVQKDSIDRIERETKPIVAGENV
jgi:hypothetical protein